MWQVLKSALTTVEHESMMGRYALLACTLHTVLGNSGIIVRALDGLLGVKVSTALNYSSKHEIRPDRHKYVIALTPLKFD